MNIEELFTEYLAEKKSENLSAETVKTYTIMTRPFREMFGNKDAHKICKGDYLNYIDALRADGKKNDVTLASYARQIRAFLYWCMNEGFIEQFKIRVPKYQRKIKRCYTDDEMIKLLKKPSPGCAETEYVAWVLINILAATGIRIGSASELRVDDIQGEWLYIDRTKNNTGQRIYLNAELQGIIRRYRLLFSLQSDNYLFCDMQGNRYAKNSLQKLVRRYNSNRGVEQTGVHRFRHTFAKNYYLATRDIFALSKILGHSSVAVTQAYLSDLGIEELIREGQGYNPQQLYGAKRRRGKMK